LIKRASGGPMRGCRPRRAFVCRKDPRPTCASLARLIKRGLETQGKNLNHGIRVRGAKKVSGNLRAFARGSHAVTAPIRRRDSTPPPSRACRSGLFVFNFAFLRMKARRGSAPQRARDRGPPPMQKKISGILRNSARGPNAVAGPERRGN
jgi:hypothetical protein